MLCSKVGNYILTYFKELNEYKQKLFIYEQVLDYFNSGAALECHKGVLLLFLQMLLEQYYRDLIN